jgi:hypothetical protein
LFDCVIGVLGFGRSVMDVHNGITNLTKFSYRANRRSIFGGVVDVEATEVCVSLADFS